MLKEFNVFNLFSNEFKPCEVCGKKTTQLLDTYICCDCVKQLLKAGVVFLKEVNELANEFIPKYNNPNPAYGVGYITAKDENPLNENGGLE